MMKRTTAALTLAYVAAVGAVLTFTLPMVALADCCECAGGTSCFEGDLLIACGPGGACGAVQSGFVCVGQDDGGGEFSPGSCGPPLVPCCDTTTCQLVSSTNCNHPESGTSCSGAACSGCCQGLAGNPNTCSSEQGRVACLQGNGSFLAHAHCSADNTSCLVGSLDGDACDDGTQCLSGICTGGICIEPTATPTTAPTATATPTAPACDDGNKCTTGDSCHAGECIGVPVQCSKNPDPCMENLCNPTTGACDTRPVVCNDGNPCTTDTCIAGVGCQFTTLPDNTTCSDSNDCTTGDHCSAGTCVGTNVTNGITCGDTSGTCQAECESGVCNVHINDGTTCFTGTGCTKTCSGGACTTDSCQAAVGLCAVASCGTDGCSSTDKCAAAVVACGELGACDASTGACLVTPLNDGQSCDDGNVCTANDRCVNGACKGDPLGAPICVGDCNGNGQVTVDEILTLVNIALGSTPLTTCQAGDANHDGQITIDEILTAVNNALNGCGDQ